VPTMTEEARHFAVPWRRNSGRGRGRGLRIRPRIRADPTRPEPRRGAALARERARLLGSTPLRAGSTGAIWRLYGAPSIARTATTAPLFDCTLPPRRPRGGGPGWVGTVLAENTSRSGRTYAGSGLRLEVGSCNLSLQSYRLVAHAQQCGERRSGQLSLQLRMRVLSGAITVKL
jgi:hypothetical protein